MARFVSVDMEAGRLFWDALDFAIRAHQDQWRRSGDAYISHPAAVAGILTEELDVVSPVILAAALLHDTVEDVEAVTLELLGARFGKDVAALVEGCTKVSTFDGSTQNFNRRVHRKIFSGAADRLGVMLIKLADRLHNLRTLSSMPRDRRQKIATETLYIYAPMASVMGLFDLKRELYDLALTHQFPQQSKKVAHHIRTLEHTIQQQQVAETLTAALEKAGTPCRVKMRMKGLWAYFDPAHRTLLSDNEYPIEVIINPKDIPSCYQALGVVNQTYPPIPRTIRDFIANPKTSGYQGIHARANIKGINFLFKIRTREMAANNRRGTIRNWLEADAGARGDLRRSLRELFNVLADDDGQSPGELIAASSRKEIYTFTPKGECVKLPMASTVLDFAFRVHTQLGHVCSGAYVGSKKVGPDHVLKDGDRVRIIPWAEPVAFSVETQQQCRTARARNELGKTHRKKRREFERKMGQAILVQEMRRYGVPYDLAEKEEALSVLRDYAANSLEDFFILLAEGRVNLKGFINRIRRELYGNRQNFHAPTGVWNTFLLHDLETVSIKFSACCNPVPTEKNLVGLLSARGVSVHRRDCNRIKEIPCQRDQIVYLTWQQSATRVEREQSIVFMRLPAGRLWLSLNKIPEEAHVVSINCLSPNRLKEPDWEVHFRVPTLKVLGGFLKCFDGIHSSFSIET